MGFLFFCLNLHMATKKLQIFLLDYDQPTTCPHCGNRTRFDEIDSEEKKIQLHTCASVECRFSFIGEFEPEYF
jgi:hypothetical protein